jgi:hypothetical protein
MMILVRWFEHALDVPVRELGKRVPANLTTEYTPMGSNSRKNTGVQILESPRSINSPFKTGISRCIRKC